jgi:GNAT superfamily N-acetyltransferase
MRKSRETGISSITGKVLYIRHATESERIDIADILKMRTGTSPDISVADIVVASQESQPLGFAVLTKNAGGLSGCLDLYERGRGRGFGREVLRHLFDYSAVKHVAADRAGARHLRGMGFQLDRDPARKSVVLRNTCGGRRGELNLLSR